VDGEVHFAPPVVSVVGDAGAVPLMPQGLLPVDQWVELGPGARFVAKDPRTTRETTFRGPGRARACVDADEESWIAAGAFDSAVGAGETPGAEEWVATPLALLRYGAAKVTVDVPPGGAKGETVKVAAGLVYVWVADDAKGRLLGEEGGARALAALTAEASPGAGHHADTPEAAAERALTKCSTLAQTSRDQAALVLRGGADASFITNQVTTRRLAHAACSVASVRVWALPESPAKATLVTSLRAAGAAYAGLPLGG
jgi:hypothetical protein